MATIRWRGGAAAVAQVQTFAFAGTWEVGDLIRVTIGSKVWDYAVTSTTITTFLPLFVTAYNALDSSDYPEMAELTASSNSTTLTFTADTEGKPFTVTLTPLESDGGAADAQTIEGGGTATTGTEATASSGPYHWDTAANWDSGTVPTTGDSVYLERSDDDIRYGFAQSGVTLVLLEIRASFTGSLGLPPVNNDGTAYPEYRSRVLAISATTCNIGTGEGSGSGRILLNFGSVQTTLNVWQTGSAIDDDVAALQWKGTNASNVVNVYRGSIDVAGFAGETATIATLRVGFESGQDSDAAVLCASGVTLTTITQTGGEVEINSAATTITRSGGSLRINGSGAYTTITNNAGQVIYASSGTVTTYNGGPRSELDLGRDLRAKTFTTTTIQAGSSISDPGAVVTWSNGITLDRCKISDVTLDLGYNRTLTPS